MGIRRTHWRIQSQVAYGVVEPVAPAKMAASAILVLGATFAFASHAFCFAIAGDPILIWFFHMAFRRTKATVPQID